MLPDIRHSYRSFPAGHEYISSLTLRPSIEEHYPFGVDYILSNPPSLSIFNYYYNLRMFPFFDYDVSDIYTYCSAEYPTYVDIQDFLFPANLIMTNQNNSQIFNSNFRDMFITNYHATVFKNKLQSVASNDTLEITEDTYNFLKDACDVTYSLGIFSNSSGFEGFIGNHTHFCCTADKDKGVFYLNMFFSYDDEAKKLINDIVFVPKTAKVSWVTGVHSDGSLDIEHLPIETPKPIFNSFYPWLNGLSLDEYLDSYLNSEEAILLLYGEPGTGKSNLLKHLLNKYNSSALITYQDDIRDLDKMFSSFLKGQEKFLIIEDADEFLTKRESGNTSMKRLLNIADGLTSNKDKKVIFTSNLTSLNTIDSALLRDGRCYDTVKFSKLSKEESMNVATDLDINKELIVDSAYSLAQLFAIKNNKLKPRKEKPSIGFSLS